MAGWSRRRVLATAGAAAAGLLVPARTVAAEPMVEVLPRVAWAGDAAPAGAVVDEPEVRFLLVHHTVNRNDYRDTDVVALLREIHALHTRDRGWPDIAYNFIVDRFGRIWETRAGSLDRPVAGDATGGNQGFDQKCAFLGDHRDTAPSPEATDAMVGLLAFLADRSGIDTRPAATTSFESRGSNLHPPGSVVLTPTITGHRTMSQTACPGDAAHSLVRDRFPADVSARRSPAATTTSTAPPAPSRAATSSTAATEAASGSPPADERAAPVADDAVPVPVLVAAGGLGAVMLGSALALRGRRHR